MTFLRSYCFSGKQSTSHSSSHLAPIKILRRRYYSHFTSEQMETQRDAVPYPRLHSWLVVKSQFDPHSKDHTHPVIRSLNGCLLTASPSLCGNQNAIYHLKIQLHFPPLPQSFAFKLNDSIDLLINIQ